MLGLLGEYTKTSRRPLALELFYYDFSVGAILCAVVAAFTLGLLDSKELTFQDNFLITGYRNMAYALAQGWCSISEICC